MTTPAPFWDDARLDAATVGDTVAYLAAHPADAAWVLERERSRPDRQLKTRKGVLTAATRVAGGEVELDPVAGLVADVHAALAGALEARGLSAQSPDVRRAIIAQLTDKPLDRRLTAAEKRVYSVELRYAGASYREIARLVGYSSPGAAHRTVMKALEALPREPAEAVRQLAVERLEGILAGGLYRRARNGELDAIDRVLKVMRETRRYIPGVEVPLHAELTGAGGGAIIVELAIPEPVPVEPVTQAALGGWVIDLDPAAVTEEP